MIELRNLSKRFQTPDGQIDALRHINLTVNDGDIYGIIGMSGAGKSTLVRCINMLERPSEGAVILDGRNLGELSDKELRDIRHQVTMIFQSFNLLMQRTCLKNILLPLTLQGTPRKEAEERARELLRIVGLPDKANAYPAQLSGGQQQRIAIARALATNPKVLLCDEATSALDPKTTHTILDLIREINRQMGITVIVITHQMSVVQEICNRVAILENGAVVEEGEVSDVFTNPKATATQMLVYPELADGTITIGKNGTQQIRLTFNGAEAAGEPLLARMAMDLQIPASVHTASMRSITGKAYGYMLLEIPGGPDQMAAAIKYLSGHDNVLVQITGAYGKKKESIPETQPEGETEL